MERTDAIPEGSYQSAGVAGATKYKSHDREATVNTWPMAIKSAASGHSRPASAAKRRTDTTAVVALVMKLALCWRVSCIGQESSPACGLKAVAITKAARGPGAESRAADRSPARRNAGGGSSLFIPCEANRLSCEARLPICEADPYRHSIKLAKSAFLSFSSVRSCSPSNL